MLIIQVDETSHRRVLSESLQAVRVSGRHGERRALRTAPKRIMRAGEWNGIFTSRSWRVGLGIRASGHGRVCIGELSKGVTCTTMHCDRKCATLCSARKSGG